MSSRRTGIVLIAVAFALSVVCPEIARGQEIKWVFETDSLPNAATLYPDEKHPTGMVFSCGNRLIMIDGDGKLVRESDFGEPVGRAAIGDLDGDGTVEITTYYGNGTVICLDAGMKERWRYATGSEGSGFTNPVAADVNVSPGLEVLAGFQNGWLHCFSANGRILWRYWGDKFRVGQPAVGDIDGDGFAEIVFGTDNGRVYCLDGNGGTRWRFEDRMAPYGRSGPTFADLDRDGRAEVLITRSNVNNMTSLAALDCGGGFLWRTRDMMQGYVSTATADLDGDGRLEVIHCDKGNHVYCENADGSRRWMTEVGGRGIFWAPAVADVNGDGRMEIIAGTRGTPDNENTSAVVIADDGKALTRLPIEGGSNASPVVGDVDGDGELEAILVREGRGAVRPGLVCLTWKANGKIAWPSMRGNSAMTGSDVNIPPGSPKSVSAPETVGNGKLIINKAFWGGNSWKFAWEPPAPDGAFIELTIIQKDGRREVLVDDVKPGAKEKAVGCVLADDGEIVASARLMANGKRETVIASSAKALPEPPESCDIEAVQSAVGKASELGRRIGAETSALDVAMLKLGSDRERIAAMSKAAAAGQVIAQTATALRRQADDLLNMSRALGGMWKSGDDGVFAVWQDMQPWDDFDPKSVPPDMRTWPKVAHGYVKSDSPSPMSDMMVRIEAYGSEFENVALNLLNATGETIYVRASFQRPDRGQGWMKPSPPIASNIRMHQLLPVSGNWTDVVYDALPELDLSGTIILPPGEIRQLWLTVKTHGLKSGKHDAILYLGTLAQSRRLTFREVPIEIEVWPVELPTDAYQQINWARFDTDFCSDQMLQNMIDHGMSVVYGPGLPSVPVDEKGNLAGKVDWTAFDKQIARAPKHWNFLWGSYPSPVFPEGKAPKEGEEETRFNAVKTAIGEMVRHLNWLGIGYDRWAFYPIDEPWNTGFTHIPALREFCKLTKRADSNVRNYTDPAGLVRIEYLEEFKDLIDVWQPELNLLKRDPELAKWFRENARTFWFYEAPGPSKDLKPLGHYRTFPWMARHFGATGHGFWVYKACDIWWAKDGGVYDAVYGNENNVVTNRRWEASRDGVEDWRAFNLLDKEIARARTDGKIAEANAAEKLIAEAIEAVCGYHLRNIDEITRAVRDYEIDYATLMKYRKLVKDEIVKMRDR